MADPTREPALDFSTLVERPFIRVDGQDFAIHHPDEFSLLDRMTLFHRFEKAMGHAKRVSESNEQKEMQEAAEQASYELDKACQSVLVDAPEALLLKLRDRHKTAIVRAFTELLAGPAPATAEAEPGSGTETTAAAAAMSGTSLSHDSNGSTAATPSDG